MQNIIDNWGVIVTALLLLSEALGLIPSVKANSIFQVITNLLKGLKK